MKRKLFNGLAILAISITTIVIPNAEASVAVVLEPATASTDMGEYFPASHTIDQSGLSTSYANLVSDFDTYIASGPTSYHGEGSNIWGSTLGVRSGNFDFALGGTYRVSAMAFWNLTDDPSAVRQFNILLANNSSFARAIDLGTFTASNSVGPSSFETGAQVFSFAEMSASFVRLQILNTWSPDSSMTAFSEAAFRVSPVPEPNEWAMLLLGFGMVGYQVKRKQGKAAPVAA